MPWFFAIPEFLKKRACRYLLQHYLGQFLEEKISLDDLTVDLYNGTGTITNVPLNVEAINEALEGTSAPIKVVSGYIGRVTVSVPWTALLKDSCNVEISGLALSIAPNVIPANTDELVSMTDSLFFSMSGSSSMQLAEEVLKSGPFPGEEEAGNSPGFEGMEALARAIELVLARVQVTFTDAVVQVNYRTLDYSQEYFLKIRMRSIEFFDEMSKVESSVDAEDEEGEELPQPAAITVKVLQLSGLTIELGSTDLSSVRADLEENFSDTLTTLSPPNFMAPPSFSSSQTPHSEDSHGVPIAFASRDVTVKVKINQSEMLPGPKLEVEGFIGSLHLLISPQQLSMLLEMATGITNKGAGTSAGFEKFHPGQNRPIPKSDMKTIESQLRHQLNEQRMKSRQKEELFQADPWENSLQNGSMGESTYSSPDEFFSLDLNSSYTAVAMEKSANMEDSLVSTTSRFRGGSSSNLPQADTSHIHERCVSSNMESIPLHEGEGLQQLSESPSLAKKLPATPPMQRSPPMQRPRSGSSNASTASSYSRSSGTRSRRHSESQQDLCKYTLTVSGVTVALLEANPLYTYTTPGLPKEHSTSSTSPNSSMGSSVGSGCYGRYSSVDEGGLDPMKYFETTAELLREGVNKVVLKSAQEKLARVLPNDHLFVWLSTVRVGASTEGPQLELDFSVASAELWEYLYRNEANLPHITKPVSVSPILQLVEDSSLSKPCVKLKLSMSDDHSKKRRYGGCSEPQTSVDLSLTTAHLNADVTLLDRLQPLLTSPLRSQYNSLRSGGTLGQTMKHSLYMTSSNYHMVNLQRQAVFNQAVAVESRGRREQRTSLKINCSTLNISLKFPIPDLRETTRPPWYHPSLRPEVLYVSLSDIRGSTLLHSDMLQGQVASTFDIQLKNARAYLSCDGSVEERELFLTVSGSQQKSERRDSSADLNTASITVVIQPVSDDSVLEEASKVPRRGRGQGVGLSSYEEFEMSSGEPSPFSRRRAMFSTGKVVEKGEGSDADEEVHSEELVMPGSSREMAEFEQHATALARCAVRCTLPSVHIHLPSKGFLETLYNRFTTDLVLWQPATPASVEKANAARSMLYSCMDVLQPAATQEDRFMMCKSVLKEEDSDDEGQDEVSQALLYPPTPHDTPSAQPQGLSTLAFSLSVEEGRVSMITAVEEEPSLGSHDEDHMSSIYMSATSDGQLLDLSPRRKSAPTSHHVHGQVVAKFSDFHVFAVSGYLGDSTHNYCFVQLHEFSLYHLGSLEAANLPPYSCVEEGDAAQTLASLQSVLFKSKGSGKPTSSREEGEEEPMLVVAMEMKLDKPRNSKTNKCAVALRNTTLQYHMTSMAHSCFKQLGTFFDLVDEPVHGYEPPSLITELHTHLQECSMEYRPLHLPLSVRLMIESVSLSASVVTGSPLLVVRLMVDGTYFLLSNCQGGCTTDLQQEWVCVMEMDWFEMTLRLCNNAQCEGDYQKLFSRLPEISLECSSNTLHLRTCVDSCIALRDLLVYLATNGDLQPHCHETAQLRDYSSLVIDTSPPSSLNSYTDPPPVSTLNGNDDIGDLISDAMEDLPSPKTSRKTEPSYGRERTPRREEVASVLSTRYDRVGKSRNRKVVGEESGPKSSKSKTQIHVSSEKSVHMVFDSDSDSEGVPGGGVSGASVHSPRGRLSGSEQGSVLSESDEDFCILDAPTSTRVPPGAKPVVKCLLQQEEKLQVNENHFTVPDRHTDQLQRPKHFPEPITQYTLKEITVIWHLYGGRDFGPPPHDSSSSTPSPGSSPLIIRRGSKDGSRPVTPIRTSGTNGARGLGSGTSPVTPRKYSTSPKSSPPFVAFGGVSKTKGKKVVGGKRPGGTQDWKTAGGPGRDHDILMELELDKLRIQHEVYPPDAEQASRLVLLVHDVEMRDRLAHSQINKFLYQYTTEAMPRQSHANMVCLKVLFTRPELATKPSIEEVSVRLSILPIRLNIDQDAVFFLYEFLRQVADTTSLAVPTITASSSGVGTLEETGDGGSGERTSVAEDVFIRSFVFHPDLPIRVDYEGKRFNMMAVGTLAGILLGLSHLDCSEVRLKALTYKKGLLGWDKLVEYASKEWIEDIRGSQLPRILKGVGPMHHVTQLVQGMVDLVWLPVQQYQEDGRIMRGLQRGASSFSTSSGVAIVELLGRALHTVQSFAQMAYDLVTPSEQQSSSQALVHQHKAPHEPLDFREGLANAYDVVSAGIGGTARDLVTMATHEHDERGVTGAVGGVLRQLPGTIVKPVILMSEATRHVLGGVKNQFVPDARREASEKWKTSEACEQ